MARRRAAAPAPPRGGGEIPRELLVGRCIEVWADLDDDRPPMAVPGPMFTATRRWSAARTAWLQERGLADDRGRVDWHRTRAAFGLALADRSAWSVAFMDARGRREYVDELLAHAGATREDLPALRAAAQRRWTAAQTRRTP